MQGPDQAGFYVLEKTLPRGDFEYKFVINGKDWFADPSNMRTTGATGNSLLRLGE